MLNFYFARISTIYFARILTIEVLTTDLEEIDAILGGGTKDGLSGHGVAVLIEEAAVTGGRREGGRSGVSND